MSARLRNIMGRAARMNGMGMTNADYRMTLDNGQPYPWRNPEAAHPPGMDGLSDVPFDYGRPYAGSVFAPYDGGGPLGGLTDQAAAFWAGLPMAGKIAVGVGAYYLARKFLR